MTLPNEKQGKFGRLLGGAVGVVFIGCAIAIVVHSEERTLGEIAAVIALGGLGVDALVSAARNRRSLLARIGPLP